MSLLLLHHPLFLSLLLQLMDASHKRFCLTADHFSLSQAFLLLVLSRNQFISQFSVLHQESLQLLLVVTQDLSDGLLTFILLCKNLLLSTLKFNFELTALTRFELTIQKILPCFSSSGCRPLVIRSDYLVDVTILEDVKIHFAPGSLYICHCQLEGIQWGLLRSGVLCHRNARELKGWNHWCFVGSVQLIVEFRFVSCV